MTGTTVVRAKFKVASISGETLKSVSMHAVTGGSPENDKFFAASPGGSISLGILNAEASAHFEPGAEYYVDFIKVKAAAEAEPEPA